MKNFISPNSHPSSFFTGSTLESMVSKAKELGTGYYTCTDHGHLANILRAYNYAKKKELKLIAGCDIYFLDPNCDITKNTKAKQIKYYTLAIHAKTQEAYQVLVKKISDKSRSTVTILEQEYPLFTWSDLEDFAKNDFTAVIGGPQDIVCKNLLVDEPVVAAKVFSKLKGMFGQNLYSSVIPLELDKKWVNQSIFTLADGQTVTLDSSILAETDYAQTFRVTLEEVANKPEKHKKIRRIYVNNIGYKVNKDVISACNHKDFKDIGVDIYKKYNTFIKMMSERMGVPILISDYSYLADEGDKLVQDLKLGEDVRFYSKNSIKTTQDVLPYLRTLFSDQEIETMIDNSYKWASNFDNFKLKYDYRMVREHENTLAAAMDLIKKIGRFNSKNPEHLKRLKQEIDVIHFNGEIDLLPYFFPIVKVNNFYTEQNRLVGPARGSAGGSFLLYCMGVTQINPLKYGLYFSRFLTLGRILKGSLPDVDCDYGDRDILVQPGGLLDTLYKDRWAQISTRSLMRLKSSIRDVNRFKKGKVEEEIEKLAKSIEATPQGISDNDFVFGYEDSDGAHVPGLLEKDENLKKYTEERPEEWEIVRKTLGIPRQNGRHASAFVISDIPISEVIPTMKVNGVENVTQYEAKEVEAAGLIKYDFLVVKCLNDIELAIKHINKHNCYGNENVGDIKSGYFFHKGNFQYIWDLPEELEVFNMLGEGKTETVFQLNTTSVTPYVQKAQPKTIEECAVVTSLVRPGPLDFIDEKTGRNMAEEYIERVNGRSKGEIEILDQLIPETHGVMCVAKGSKVKTKKGLVNIEDVQEGTLVQVENGEYKEVLKNIYQGRKRTITIRLDNSEELCVTKDHKVLTQRGWVEAQDLTPQDLVKHFWVSDSHIDVGDDKDWVVGMLLADGQINQSTYNIAAGTQEKALKIKEIVDNAFGVDCNIYHHTRCWYVRLSAKDYSNKVSNEKRKNPIKKYCESLGLDGLNCYSKKFPDRISKRMIEGFIEGDGNVINKRVRICNELMARQIFETLQAMRIKSNLFKDNDVWTVGFNQNNLEYKIKTKQRDKEFDLYVPKQQWSLKRSDNRRQYFTPKKMVKTPFIQRKTALKIARDYNFQVTTQTWSKVLQIQEGEVQDVYDLSINEIHSFVVGGNVVHNCFQEQITKITKKMAGWDDEKAEDVRIAVGKKQLKMITELKPQFIESSVNNGIEEDTAKNVWAMIETFGRYGFNKSHAVAYAMIAYACAYLKYHYPLEWWAAVLSNADDKEIKEVLWPYVKDMVSPPDINMSNEEMIIDYRSGTIRNKLSILKGLGPKVANRITEGRPYADIHQFIRKEVVGASLARKLIHVGVMDSLFPKDSNLMEKMQIFEDACNEWDYRKKIFEKSEREIPMNHPIEKFIEIAKKHPKTSRCKHEVKKGEIDLKYAWIDPVQDYILKKSIFPTMPMELTPIIKKESKSVQIFNTEAASYALSPYGREVRLVDGKILQNIKQIPHQPGSQQIVDFCIVGYVVEAKEFSYKNGEKTALKIILDIDGFTEEFVHWPDYDSGILQYPKDLKKESVIFLFMSRKMGKEQYHTNIGGIVVESV